MFCIFLSTQTTHTPDSRLVLLFNKHSTVYISNTSSKKEPEVFHSLHLKYILEKRARSILNNTSLYYLVQIQCLNINEPALPSLNQLAKSYSVNLIHKTLDMIGTHSRRSGLKCSNFLNSNDFVYLKVLPRPNEKLNSH